MIAKWCYYFIQHYKLKLTLQMETVLHAYLYLRLYHASFLGFEMQLRRKIRLTNSKANLRLTAALN